MRNPYGRTCAWGVSPNLLPNMIENSFSQTAKADSHESRTWAHGLSKHLNLSLAVHKILLVPATYSAVLELALTAFDSITNGGATNGLSTYTATINS